MRFTVLPPGAAFPEDAAPLKPALPPLGKKWKRYTAPGCYEVVKAVTADGEWMFERAGDGTWMTGYLPTETVVKAGIRSLRACRSYAASGEASADLERIQAQLEEGKDVA